MSVIEKIENYWRGVCDPRYPTKSPAALHGGKLFDRTSRRCQSSLNIYSQRAPNKPISNHHHHHHGLQRKLTTAHDHGNYNNIKLPCRNSDQHSRGGTDLNHPLVPSSSTTGGITLKNRKTSSSASSSSNNGTTGVKNSSSVGSILPQHCHENVVAKFTTQSESDKLCDKSELLIATLEGPTSTCPDPEVNHPYESVKMRLSSKPDGRPKSVEFSHKNDWIRLYRDIEVNAAVKAKQVKNKESSNSDLRCSVPALNCKPMTDKNRTSRGRSTSIVHLHRLDSQGDVKENSNFDTLSHNSDDGSVGKGSSGPSLFQRFTKTFSLRFGNGSSSSSGGNHYGRKTKKLKYGVGSSPDLYHREEDSSGWRWRQSSLNPQREEKCRSGDSGIGLGPEDVTGVVLRSSRRNRKIKSETGETILEHSTVPDASLKDLESSAFTPSAAICNSPIPHMDSPLCRKLSLVEIPTHTWDTCLNNGRQKSPSGSSSGSCSNVSSSKNSSASQELSKSYEDLLESKLDDDGFVSSDEQDEKMGLASRPPLPNYGNSQHRNNNNHSNDIGQNSAKVLSELSVNKDGGIRGRVISEILNTERGYVKTLNDIVQGFLVPCRRRKDLFTMRIIENIFSNVEALLRLHARFLEALVSCLDKENLADSAFGHTFTLWADEFDAYCEYCCNNPVSMCTVQNLVSNAEYSEFFEACRRIQMMDKLPLHGFLLRPVQRICQYHLQLNELLKHTQPEHKDFESTKEALEWMKKVAEKVNDAQREFDSMHEMMKLQNSMDLFEGPNLMDRNVKILQRGDLVKAHQGRKHKEVHVIVLSSELVICKRIQKDMTKKNGLLFIGRIDLSHRNWVDINSNEDEIFGIVHNSWRVYSKEKSCWVLFTALTAAEKATWLDLLKQTSPGASPLLSSLPHMKERVKELIRQQGIQEAVRTSQGQSSYQNNTLPKSKRNGRKQSAPAVISKVDSDALLIQVGQLKRNNMGSMASPASNNYSNNGRERTSVFYV